MPVIWGYQLGVWQCVPVNESIKLLLGRQRPNTFASLNVSDCSAEISQVTESVAALIAVCRQNLLGLLAEQRGECGE